MERRNITGKVYNTRMIICAVMAVFCVLALIEIIYGRTHSQTTQGLTAKEENSNNQLIGEMSVAGKDDTGIENPTGTENFTGAENQRSGEIVGDGQTPINTDVPDIPLQGGPTESIEGKDGAAKTEAGSAAGNAAENNAAKGGAKGGSENAAVNSTENYDMQIVFMGDSILDSVREYDGVAYLISQACNAKVYNMAIGGTTAALMQDEKYSFGEWTSCSLLGIVHAILGDIDGKIFEPYRAGEILEECDFSKTDYFIIEYGVNDFLAKIPDSCYTNDGELRNIDALHTYVGALESAINLLHNAFPDAKIMVISPHYCQFFSGEAYVGDSYSLDYGYGPMIDYSELCGYVYNENKDKNVIYYNSILDSGIDAYSADDYLEDGVHLTSAGRHAYADYASRLINSTFRKNE